MKIFHAFFAVHGPSRDSDLICLGCYDAIDENDPDCCSDCGLPVCGRSEEKGCEKTAQHRAECQAIRKVGRSRSLALLDDSALLHDVVLVLRCIDLKESDPEGWEELLQLEGHLEERRSDDEVVERIERITSFVLNDLVVEDVDPGVIERLCGALDVNSFEVPHRDGVVQALYRRCCLAEHNCVPNLHRSFAQDLTLTFRSAIKIGANDHLTITYTDSLWTTADRRAFLAATKYFDCMCDRCMDPTELGTNLSSLACLKCPVGAVLPNDPLDPDTEWACEACSAAMPASTVSRVNEQAAQTLSMLEQTDPSPDQLEKFLVIHSRVLAPQHAVMVDCKHTLLHLLGQSEGLTMPDLSDKQLQTKEELARGLIAVADKLIPGTKGC